MSRTEQLRGALATFHLRAVERCAATRPVPLAYWSGIHALARATWNTPDPLLPPRVVGTWSLDARSMEFLWRTLLHDRPRTIIECGAGASTLMLARYAAHVSDTPVRVISFEQNLSVKAQVEERLAALDARACRVLHAPVSTLGDYAFDIVAAAEELGQRRADWLLIDGPAGPDGCRLSTLPQLSPLCRPGARWYLDDAFRAGELGILREWQTMPGIHVDGIHPIGKGLATGTLL